MSEISDLKQSIYMGLMLLEEFEATSEISQGAYDSITDMLDRADEAVCYAVEFYDEFRDWKEAG